MDQQEIIDALRPLAPTELARLWVRITGLIPEVELSPPLEEMAADYRLVSVSEQRFFLMHVERFLQQALKLQRGA